MAEKYKPSPLRLTLEKMLKKALRVQGKNEREKERLEWRQQLIEKEELTLASLRAEITEWHQIKVTHSIFCNAIKHELAKTDAEKMLGNIQKAHSDFQKRLHAIKGKW